MGDVSHTTLSYCAYREYDQLPKKVLLRSHVVGNSPNVKFVVYTVCAVSVRI